jgi:hypothetical protein
MLWMSTRTKRRLTHGGSLIAGHYPRTAWAVALIGTGIAAPRIHG